MKLLLKAVALVLLVGSAARAQTPQSAADPPSRPPPHSIQLWNGHDLTGWVTFFKAGPQQPSGFWTASHGVLHLARTSPGYLRTEKSFTNYRLHVEWRWPGPAKSGTNNSGIFVLQQPPDAVWPYSVQVQVKAGSTGDLIAQDGLVFSPGDTMLTLKKSAPDSERPAGQWNSIEIECRGANIEVFVNGVRQNVAHHLPVASGQIALQMEGYPIDFKNIWLRSL